MKTIARAVAVALMTAGAVAVPLTAEASATPLPDRFPRRPSPPPSTAATVRGSTTLPLPQQRGSAPLPRVDLRRYRGYDRRLCLDRYRNRCDRHSGWDLGRYRHGRYSLYSYGWDCCRH
ncbi:hypothetical protein E4K10_41850 [Streptomyces sp. T1317-0309]|nr:hypothetical protein E4K10_41850 [Streptomyces sp. T1317-0309]